MAQETRTEAAKRGMATYDTGKPCKHGHNSPRDTLSGACIECRGLYAKTHRDKISRLLREARGG